MLPPSVSGRRKPRFASFKCFLLNNKTRQAIFPNNICSHSNLEELLLLVQLGDEVVEVGDLVVEGPHRVVAARLLRLGFRDLLLQVGRVSLHPWSKAGHWSGTDNVA